MTWKLSSLAFFLIFLYIPFLSHSTSSDVYYMPFQIEDTWLSEKNLTDCAKYEEAHLYVENYPLYAFDLLVDCYTENVSKHFLDLSDKFDTLVAGSMLLDEVKSEYSQLKNEMDSFHPETLPAQEWFSLAIKNIENADTYIKGAGLSLENPQSTDQNVKNSFNQYVLAGLILVVIVITLALVKRVRK